MVDEYMNSILYLRVVYDPPYDSSIEDLFAYNMVKYIEMSVELHRQFEIKAICGQFRIDFVLETDDLRVGIECDGADYHDFNRDEWRDAMILGTNNIDFMYRLRGIDIYRHIDDILYVISRNHPSLFSQRGLLNLASLASEGAQQYAPITPFSFLTIRYRDENGRVSDSVEIDARQRCIPRGMRQPWQTYFNRARLKPGLTLDELIKDYKDETERNTVTIENG